MVLLTLVDEVLGSRLPERDVVDVDRHDDVAGVDAVGGVAWMDAVPGGQCDAVYGNEAVEQVGGRGAGDDLDLVVVPREAARIVEVEGLLRAVAGQVLRPFDAQPLESLSVLALGWELLNAEAGKGEAERLGEVCPHRGSYEVGELQTRPRGVEG